MSVIVRLLQYNNYEVLLDRNRLLELFPTSFLSTTLNLDPTAEVIDIPSRDVTPNMLNIVKIMIDTDNVALYDSKIPKEEYIRASNYLNIDILTAMVDPNYNLFVQSHPLMNLLHITDDDFDEILPFSATSGGNQLVWYLFRTLPFNLLYYISFSNSMLVVASYYGSIDVVRLLLRREGVNPGTATVNDYTYGRYIKNTDVIYPYYNILRNTQNQAYILRLFRIK